MKALNHVQGDWPVIQQKAKVRMLKQSSQEDNRIQIL